MSIAREVLSDQGFGCGGSIATSGELGVFELLAGSDSPVLFDVGGHVGYYAAAFVRSFPNGRAFVFEPSAAHFSRLLEHVGGRRNVTLLQKALGAASGKATLYKDAEVTGLASLTRRRLGHFGIEMDKKEQVQVSTLDEARAENSIDFIDLLKIDVEGSELDVLSGATLAFDQGAIGAVQVRVWWLQSRYADKSQGFFLLLRRPPVQAAYCKAHRCDPSSSRIRRDVRAISDDQLRRASAGKEFRIGNRRYTRCMGSGLQFDNDAPGRLAGRMAHGQE